MARIVTAFLRYKRPALGFQNTRTAGTSERSKSQDGATEALRSGVLFDWFNLVHLWTRGFAGQNPLNFFVPPCAHPPKSIPVKNFLTLKEVLCIFWVGSFPPEYWQGGQETGRCAGKRKSVTAQIFLARTASEGLKCLWTTVPVCSAAACFFLPAWWAAVWASITWGALQMC